MTRIAIVGAHGKVAQQLMRILYDNGDEFIGIVRGEDHADDIYRLGGDGVRLDIETATVEQVAAVFEGSDAVVFTAGAGPDSGVERKRTVDFDGSVKSAEAARIARITRFIQVSAMGVDAPVAADATEDWAAYVAAKRDADASLRDSGLDWTILRPGALTNDDGNGAVTLAETTGRGSIPREDVAALIVAAINTPATIRRQWEVVSGDTPIADAIAAAAGGQP